MANKIPQICFDEIETAKSILCFEKYRRNIMRRHYKEKFYLEYFILITKYLLYLGKETNEILDILRKHTALCLYYSEVFYKNRDDNERIASNKMTFRIAEFDTILSKEAIDIDSFVKIDLTTTKNRNNPFSGLFIGTNFREIVNSNKYILELFEDNEGSRLKLKYLLKTYFDYFNYNSKFKNNLIGDYGHFDLLVAHCINSGGLSSFFFETLDDNYKIYLPKKIDISEEKYNKPLLGYIINIIFINDNLQFDKVMDTRSDYFYNIMLSRGRGKTISSLYSFFVNNEKKATINKEVIVESFDFEYNNIKYKFTKNGIIKL